MTQGTIKIINKNLTMQRNDKQKLINSMVREMATIKN